MSESRMNALLALAVLFLMATGIVIMEQASESSKRGQSAGDDEYLIEKSVPLNQQNIDNLRISTVTRGGSSGPIQVDQDYLVFYAYDIVRFIACPFDEINIDLDSTLEYDYISVSSERSRWETSYMEFASTVTLHVNSRENYDKWIAYLGTLKSGEEESSPPLVTK